MKTNRRTFFKTSALVVASESPAMEPPATQTGVPSRLLVNHLGFLPDAGKYFVVTNPPAGEFAVQRVTNPGKMVRTTVYQGRLKQAGTDLGSAWLGDFSGVREEGLYRITCGNLESRYVQNS